MHPPKWPLASYSTACPTTGSFLWSGPRWAIEGASSACVGTLERMLPRSASTSLCAWARTLCAARCCLSTTSSAAVLASSRSPSAAAALACIAIAVKSKADPSCLPLPPAMPPARDEPPPPACTASVAAAGRELPLMASHTAHRLAVGSLSNVHAPQAHGLLDTACSSSRRSASHTAHRIAPGWFNNVHAPHAHPMRSGRRVHPEVPAA